jgi:tetratricopeptide (TPR) repeat protein
MLGSILSQRGDTAAAIEPLERAYKIRKDKLGQDASQTLRSERLLAEAYLAAGKPERAVELMTARVDRIERRLGTEHPSLVRPLYYLAQSLHDNGQTERAKEVAARAKTIEELADGS